jgi:hypothetical protein
MKRLSLAVATLVLAGGAWLALAGGRGEPTPAPTAAPAESLPRWVPAVRVAAPDQFIGAPSFPDPLPAPGLEAVPPEAQDLHRAPNPDGLVGELIAILNETKSVDTFAVTCGLLEKMGAEARPAVPAMLRNAERLGLLKKGLLTGKKGRRQEAADSLAEMMEHIVAPRRESWADADPRRGGAEPAQEPPGPGVPPTGSAPLMPPASDR